MVSFTSMYESFIKDVQTSDFYRNTTKTEKQLIDNFLEKEEIKKYFGTKVVPKLTFHESFILSLTNSDAFQQRTPQEQEKMIKYLNIEGTKNIFNRLDNIIN